MCGIVYAHDFTGAPVNNGIMQQFDNQRSRGVEGFGLFDGQEMNMVKASKEDGILKWLVKYDSNLLLFHHRRPTSTINVKRAAHPFSTKGHFGENQYILVHNGVIHNAWELRKEHEKLGIKYQSVLQDGKFNDSEAFLWDMALYLEGEQKELKVEGNIAFVCIKTLNGGLDKLYFGRNTNPLNMFRDKKGIALSSEGNGDEIERDTLYTFNYDLHRLTSRELEIPTKSWTNYNKDNACSQNNWNNSIGKALGGYLSNEYTVYDYDRNGNPVYNDWESYAEQYASADPEKQEVEECVMDYLIECQGNFESAYWKCEMDYDALLEETDAWAYSECILLEQVLEAIENDPEHRSGKLVSSKWEALWT